MESKTQTRSTKQRIVRWIKIIIILYCIIGIALYYLQDRFLFHPAAIGDADSLKIEQPHKELSIKVDEETRYSVVQFTTLDSMSKGVVLYFHGNMDNIEHYAHVAKEYTKYGYELWMVDYPTFGKSRGELTEEAMYEEALQLYKMARARFTPDSIIIYGRSLGTGVAAQLASIRDCRHLFLEAPYYSMPSMARRYFWMYPVGQMVKYKFPTNEYLQKVTAPITIFHGTDDGVIAYSNSEKLKTVLKPQDSYVTVENGKHNNLLTFAKVKSAIADVLQKK